MSDTIFDRIGGMPALPQVVRQFYRGIYASQVVGHHFTMMDPEVMIDHQIRFLSTLLGGPAQYTGKDLGSTHAHLNITEDEFSEVAKILSNSLKDNGVSGDDLDTIMSTVAGTKEEILHGSL